MRKNLTRQLIKLTNEKFIADDIENDNVLDIKFLCVLP